ncbi:hypothetical protein KZJ38_30015 [Paraburkholderia edwinii]|uniref:Cytotoxic necrotizing factor Rho-activating domain-containing protein n=1 Tax=Paraburkholderia edwinii TaxID=2861782 RepID=A0ABX8UQL3_9BURK|nr:cytotoxic necrotizing factor Rho-activating domain-containing protein [Paraburkholderia edwinii]QYD71279.1 hypothetical protein KZJ38_30015 [Paraburkholderia edwinii]
MGTSREPTAGATGAGSPARRANIDVEMARYPEASPLANRFLLFDERVRQIADRHDRGGELSIEEGEALKFHDALLDRLAFLREDGTRAGDPVAHARVADPEPEPDAPPTETQKPESYGPSNVRYVGGVRIKTDYSLREVLDTTAKAAKSPFASFVASARDLVKKATQGQALTADEEEKVYRYAGMVDAFVSLTPEGSMMHVVGTALDGLNAAIDGRMPDQGQLSDDLLGSMKFVKSREGTSVAGGEGDQTAGKARERVPHVTPEPVTPEPATVVPAAGTSVGPDHSLFDFPLFNIPFGRNEHETSPIYSRTLPIIHKPAFKPPTVLPDGRVGYPLSPTTPPKLPPETGSGATVGSDGAGVSKHAEQPTARIDETDAAIVADEDDIKQDRPVTNDDGKAKDKDSAGETSPDRGKGASKGKSTTKQKDITGGKRSKGENSTVERTGKPGCYSSCLPLPRSTSGPGSEFKRVEGRGPISVTVAGSALEDHARVERFNSQFFFYRNDRDVKDMDGLAGIRGTDYEQRRAVLAVGDGTQATSLSSESKIHAGAFWGRGPATHLQGAEIIELGNGRDGVGAIKLPFANVRAGATVIVTGGAMNGCTMLFGSDGTSLYAYHAGSSDPSSKWLTAREGAQSIVDAHVKIGPREQIKYRWHGNNDDLITVGRQYRFSALIYSGRHLANVSSLVGSASVLGAVAGAPETVPDSNLNVPRVAVGGSGGKNWHMMTFNYYEHEPSLRTVGTAEAIVSKDLNGKVTVSVLAEKGKLDRGSSLGERGSPIVYQYTTLDKYMMSYQPAAHT